MNARTGSIWRRTPKGVRWEVTARWAPGVGAPLTVEITSEKGKRRWLLESALLETFTEEKEA